MFIMALVIIAETFDNDKLTGILTNIMCLAFLIGVEVFFTYQAFKGGINITLLSFLILFWLFGLYAVYKILIKDK